MANEQAQAPANAPDPDAVAAELHAKIQHATSGAGAPPGAQAAILDWGSLVPTAAELDELSGLSKEALAFVVKYAQNHVFGLIGLGGGGIRPV